MMLLLVGTGMDEDEDADGNVIGLLTVRCNGIVKTETFHMDKQFIGKSHTLL